MLNKGATELRRILPSLFEDAEKEFTNAMRARIHREYTRLITLDDELKWYHAEQKNTFTKAQCANDC